MELIKEIESRRNKNGILKKWAIFKCPDLYCGQEVERQLGNGLRAKSCGCVQYKENKGNFKDGRTGIRLYRIWHGIKQRILNPNRINYKDYGGRGITICNEWLEFIPFRDWSLSNGYKEGLTIDRKENNDNYEPSNCQWITQEENNRKRGYNKIKNMEQSDEIKALDATGNYTQKELAIKYNVSEVTISNIINNKRWKRNENIKEIKI